MIAGGLATDSLRLADKTNQYLLPRRCRSPPLQTRTPVKSPVYRVMPPQVLSQLRFSCNNSPDSAEWAHLPPIDCECGRAGGRAWNVVALCCYNLLLRRSTTWVGICYRDSLSSPASLLKRDQHGRAHASTPPWRLMDSIFTTTRKSADWLWGSPPERKPRLSADRRTQSSYLAQCIKCEPRVL